MPRFHFNTNEMNDAEGHDFPSIAVAKCEAMKLAARIICEEVHDFWQRAEWTLTVTDENGLMMFQLQVIGTESPAIWAGSSRRSA